MHTLHRVPFAATLCLALLPAQEPTKAPVEVKDAAAVQILGEGSWRYRWVKGWPVLEEGKNVGSTHGCMVVDAKGRLLVNTETEQAVMIFSTEGKLVGSWGKDFQGGLHGMTLRVEDGTEFLYLAHTRRHEVLKTTLDGKVLWTLGWPEASGIYKNEGEYKPTAVAVGADGRLFVADGYGKSWVHLFDKDRKYVKSFGGPGKEPGKMQTCHGLWLDGRGKEPLLLVCDRENHRLQWFTMDGEFVRLHDKDLRRPCNVWPLEDGALAVADLQGRVTLLDKDGKLLAQLGDNPDEKLRAQNAVKPEQWRDGQFLSPHSVCSDSKGNLYVMDWNFLGRITRLERLR